MSPMKTKRSFRLEFVAGASRSGKTFLTAERIKKDRNVLVWDSMGEFAAMPGYSGTNSLAVFAEHAAKGGGGKRCLVVPVTPANFDAFCRSAWRWMLVHAASGRVVTIVVEELADVTPPGKAPVAWGMIIRRSLRFFPHIYALTQRPAESDKTVMGNATVLRCHSMARADDRRTMARELDVDQDYINRLDFSRYQFIELDRVSRRLTTGGKGARARIVA